MIFLFPTLFLMFNPFQSNFSATRLLPSYYLFWTGKGWWITCNYPTVLKEKNRNRKSTICAISWLKSVLHEEKRREKENHRIGRSPTLWSISTHILSWCPLEPNFVLILYWRQTLLQYLTLGHDSVLL
jgi:hypothetical protein